MKHLSGGGISHFQWFLLHFLAATSAPCNCVLCILLGYLWLHFLFSLELKPPDWFLASVLAPQLFGDALGQTAVVFQPLSWFRKILYFNVFHIIQNNFTLAFHLYFPLKCGQPFKETDFAPVFLDKEKHKCHRTIQSPQGEELCTGIIFFFPIWAFDLPAKDSTSISLHHPEKQQGEIYPRLLLHFSP